MADLSPLFLVNNMRQQGFITLTFAVIVSAILLLIVASLSVSAFTVSGQSLEMADSFSAQAEILSCTQIVLLKILSLSDYSGSEVIQGARSQCTVGVRDVQDPQVDSFHILTQRNRAQTAMKVSITKLAPYVIRYYQIPVADLP